MKLIRAAGRFPTMSALGILLLLACSVESANATTITFDVANLGGNTWEYNYTVINDTLGVPIEEFTIYFDPASYGILSPGPAPAGWDPLVVQPFNDPFDPRGFYDAFALFAPPISPGDSLGGFTVTFEYLLAGTPGSQLFEIVTFNPLSFDLQVIDSAQTIPAVVPLPAAAWLFGTALLGFVGYSRRRKII